VAARYYFALLLHRFELEFYPVAAFQVDMAIPASEGSHLAWVEGHAAADAAAAGSPV